ncbi:hypothetical protein V9K67_15835 [Paraflavisolibacter sp. H34]|uniref:hypothetical protein n=1 Tax=Huijunlia imazamoxiresistens TaxID=3127457 RepID=UPI0030188A73
MRTAFLALSLTGLLLPSLSSRAQATLQQQAMVLKRVIETNHVRPRPVDDAFSNDLFHRFLEALDHRRLYLTATDFAFLEKYRPTLDDELNGNGTRRAKPSWTCICPIPNRGAE